MRLALVLLLAGNAAWADDITVAVTPSVVVEPTVATKPAGIQGVFAGYRGDVTGGRMSNGAALQILWGRPDSPFELEWMPSWTWGRDRDRQFGQIQLSLGLRHVWNKLGDVRPYAVGSAAFTSFAIDDGRSTTRANSVGGHGGIGIDVALRYPGAVSFDVRGGPLVDLETRERAWNVFATLTIGLYFPDEHARDGTQALVPVAVR
jgi:hypothetical protein